MKMSDVLKMVEKIENSNSDNLFQNAANLSDEVGEYMNQMADSGREIILSKVGEEKLVGSMNIMRAVLLTSMIHRGVGADLLVAEIGGELKMFTDTIVLTMIGVLADEEII